MDDQDSSDSGDSDWDRLSVEARGGHDEVEASLLVEPGQPANFLEPQAPTSNRESHDAPSLKRTKKKYKKKTQPNLPAQNADRYGFKIPENPWKNQRKGIKSKAQKKYEKKVREHEHNLQQSKGAHATPQSGICGEHGGIPAAKPQAFESDESIPEHDSYHEKGCERRMVFRSDLVPPELQYKMQKSTEPSAVVQNPAANALSKFLEWCRTRPTSDMKTRAPEKYDEEACQDSKKSRHFVLIMGPPDGPYGDADRLAAQLESACKQYFKTRLRNSHFTIETEIPYIKLTGMGYFTKYLEALLSLKDPKKLGHRLSIKIAGVPTEHLLRAGPELFYDQPVDVEVAWQQALDCTWPNLFIMSCIPGGYRYGGMWAHPDLDRPDPNTIEKAKGYFAIRKQDEVVKRKEYISEALLKTKKLIESILWSRREKTPAVVAKSNNIVSEENGPESMPVHDRSQQQVFEPPMNPQNVAVDIIDLTGDTTSSKSMNNGVESTDPESTQVVSVPSDLTAAWVEQQRSYEPFHEDVGDCLPSLQFHNYQEGNQLEISESQSSMPSTPHSVTQRQHPWSPPPQQHNLATFDGVEDSRPLGTLNSPQTVDLVPKSYDLKQGCSPQLASLPTSHASPAPEIPDLVSEHLGNVRVVSTSPIGCTEPPSETVSTVVLPTSTTTVGKRKRCEYDAEELLVISKRSKMLQHYFCP